MNIIKFKDLIKEDDTFFNENLKGKYAYWVRMQYALPLDAITVEEYTDMERNGQSGEYIDTLDNAYLPFIDQTETEKVNSISQYAHYNSYSTDSDITLDELKVFRRWLADTLLSFEEDYDYTENVEHMLLYYSADMYDDTVKWLGQFGQVTYSFSEVYGVVDPKKGVPVGCGCSGVGQNLSNLYGTSLQSCDPLSVYRKNIWSLMVETFSDPNFWMQFNVLFLTEFKHYIDNILQAGLPLVSSEWTSVFADCSCGQTPDSSNSAILSHLSQSLGYIIDSQQDGHMNFIAKSFNDWASVLYERMFWA
jgi:hypothetical protein